MGQLYVMDTNCIYFKYGPSTCKKYGKRNKRCQPKGCKHKTRENITGKAFDEAKWYWKTSMNIMCNVFHAAVYLEQHKLSDKTYKACSERGHYRFIARDTDTIIKMLVHLRKHFGESTKKIKFLDCGAGIGNVVALAFNAGFDAYGLEYNKLNLKHGKSFLRRFQVEPSRLFQGDLLEFNDFDKYDVLYGYCPMSDGKLEKQFEHRMYKQMKKGAMVIGINPGKCVRIGRCERVYFQRLMLRDTEYDSANPYIKVAHETR